MHGQLARWHASTYDEGVSDTRIHSPRTPVPTEKVLALLLRDPAKRLDLLARIAAKTRPVGKGCKEWTGLRSRGYAVITLSGIRRHVGSVLLYLQSGRFPTRVKRTCGNRRCLEHIVAVKPAKRTKATQLRLPLKPKAKRSNAKTKTKPHATGAK